MTDALTALAATFAKLEGVPVGDAHRIRARRVLLTLQDIGWDITPDFQGVQARKLQRADA